MKGVHYDVYDAIGGTKGRLVAGSGREKLISYLASTATVVFFFNDYWCEPRNARMGTCSVFVVRSNVTTMREKECTSYKDE